MIPHKLVVSGFLSYRQPVELDFSGFSLACISGQNGAGKSSLLDAITWALFGQARKRDDSIINTHPQVQAAEVVFLFEYEGSFYRVQRTAPRGKTTLLELHVGQGPAASGQPMEWKPLTERTQRETQERIEGILRMDYETFINASFFLQDKADQFTQQRASDRKRILGSILGLEIWETYRQNAAERRRGVEAQVRELQGRLSEIVQELAEEQGRKERLGVLQAELEQATAARQAQELALESMKQAATTLAEQRRLVQMLARQLEAAKNRWNEVQARFAARQDEKQSYADLIQRAGQIRADYQAWQSVREALHTQAAQAERYRQLERQRLELDSEVAAEGARLQQEAASLKARALEVQNQQRRLPDLLGQFKAAQQAFTQAEMDLKKKAKLEEEYTLARQKWPKLKADNQRLQAEMEEIKAHILQLGQGSEGVCPTCGQKLTQADCERLLESLEAQGKDKGNLYRANKALLDQAEQVERALMQQIQALSSAQAMALAQGRVVEQAAAQIRQIEEQIVGWEKIEAPRLAEIERGLERQDYCPEARQRLAQVEEQTRALGYDPAAHEALRQQETAGQRAELELRELEKAQGMLGAAERDLADLEKQLATSQADVKTQEDDHRTAAAILAEAESLAPDVELAQRQLDGWRERENQLRMEVGAAQQKVDVLEDQRKRHRILEGALEMQNVQISRYKQLERAFGRDGVPALLIEQALPQIEARANLILDRLSAGGMAVRFVTQAAYKDKRREDLRETLEIQISDGSGTRDYEMYSGGEAFRVNFAIRLALSEVLAQRAGARLQMLVIDEGFGSQDALGRQRLVEAINLVKGDFAKILVITHIEELKDHFPNRIEVEKTPLGSQVRVL